MKNAIIYWFVFLAVQLVAGGIIISSINLKLDEASLGESNIMRINGKLLEN